LLAIRWWGFNILAMMTTKKHVLVIRIGRLGDTVLATPVIEPLQQVFGPEVKIDFAVSPGASKTILTLDRRINQVFPISHRRVPWRINPEKRALRRHSRSMPYDLVINLECGAQCDDFIEFVHTREFCGRPLKQPQHIPGRHCVDTERTIYADVLGLAATEVADPSLDIPSGPEIWPIATAGNYVVLNPGFSGMQKKDYRSHRNWPIGHWAELINLITGRTDLDIVINGTEQERHCFEVLLEMPRVHSLFGSSLQALVVTLEKAKSVVSVDTGTMHLAMALGTPVIALFGPSIPGLTGPYSSRVPYRVLSSGIDCQPCYQTSLHKQCVFNRCMQELGPDLVYDALEGI